MIPAWMENGGSAAPRNGLSGNGYCIPMLANLLLYPGLPRDRLMRRISQNARSDDNYPANQESSENTVEKTRR